MFSKHVRATALVLACLATLGGCALDTDLGVGVVEQDILPPPTMVTATATSSTRVTVSWTAVPMAVKYYVYQSVGVAGPYTLKGSVVSPNAQLLVANLTPNTEYCYEVRTVQSNGSVGPFSSPPACTVTGDTAPPAPPTTVTATATGTDRINVDWSSVAAATRYSVYQSLGTMGPYTLAGTVLAPGTTYQAANLQANTLYCFKLASVNGNGEGAQSTAACATTFAAGLAGYWPLDEGSGTIVVDKSGYGRDGTVTGSAGYSSDHPLMDNNRFSIQSPGGTGDSVSVPDAPVWWLTGAFTVSLWVKVPASSTGAVQFAGKRAAGCGAVNWALFQDGGGLKFQGQTTLSFGQSAPADTWTHLAVTQSSGTAHAYVNGVEVSAGPFMIGPRSSAPMRLANTGDCAGDPVQVDHVQIYTRQLTPTEVATLGTPPPAPTNFTATVAGARRVDLAWDPVPGVSKYILYKGTVSGDEVVFASILAPATSYSDGTNVPSATSSWIVRSVRDTLISGPSNEEVVTTDPPIAAPTNVTATVVSSTRIQAGWDAVPGAVKYYVWQSAGGGTYTLRGSVLGGNPTTYTAANLTSGVMYCYEIQAQGPDSTSTMSSPACATP